MKNTWPTFGSQTLYFGNTFYFRMNNSLPKDSIILAAEEAVDYRTQKLFEVQEPIDLDAFVPVQRIFHDYDMILNKDKVATIKITGLDEIDI